MAAKPADIEAWLEQLGQPSADRDYKPGHARMQALLATLPVFRPKLRIRIAGTNGKGSTAHMLSRALHAAGLKVGLYTSPHILHFNERIRIDGEPVPNTEILGSLERLMPVALETEASYFETATAAALDVFARHGVGAEILEAGVGARLDATTAVSADMALITPIGLDHQAWLGDTLQSIAREKSHVMNGCRWSLSAPQSAEVVEVLTAANPDIRVIDTTSWPELAMPGEHQQINASLAMAAVDVLLADHTVNGDRTVLQQAIAETLIPGRLQYLHYQGSDLWLDAAHNMHGIHSLLPSLAGIADPFDAILVFSREDRDLSEAAGPLRSRGRRLYGNKGDGFDRIFDSPADALQTALAEFPGGKFLVLGSFVTLATLLRSLEPDTR